MKIRAKLIVIIAFAAIVPLGVSAFTALQVHRDAFEQSSRAQQRSAAAYRADQVYHWMTSARENLAAVVAQIPWSELSATELDGALTMVYGQLESTVFVQLVAPETAGLHAVIVTESNGGRARGRPDVTPETRQTLVRSATRTERSRTDGFTEVVHEGEPRTPLVALAIPLPGRVESWSIVVGLSLESLCRDLETDPSDALMITVLDGDQRPVCPRGEPGKLVISPSEAAAAGEQPLMRFRDERGRWNQAAVATTPTGWTILAHQLLDKALGPGRTMWRQTVYWLLASLMIAFSAAWYLARSIDEPIRALTTGANELARGNLGHRLEADGRDEFAALAGAFNTMSQEIERRDDEIRTWNESLTERVEERTRELEETQSQLMQSRKLAALSSLAAGIAHEINNPLAAVSGMAQIMLKRAAERGTRAGHDIGPLRAIETSAGRIRDIVRSLQSLVEQPSGEHFRQIDAREPVTRVVEYLTPRARDGAVSLTATLPERTVPLWCDESQLEQALTHLLGNAIAATPSGGKVEVSLDLASEQVVKLLVADTGCGIAPEHLQRVFEPFFTTKKQDWQGRGLGLTVAHEIIESHGGTIKLDSALERGTTVIVTLPATSGEVHLV